MVDVADLLEENGVNNAWIGARDLYGQDLITWIREGPAVLQEFWMVGEPEHNNGNCAFLDINGKLLGLADCESSNSYLCKWYNA